MKPKNTICLWFGFALGMFASVAAAQFQIPFRPVSQFSMITPTSEWI